MLVVVHHGNRQLRLEDRVKDLLQRDPLRALDLPLQRLELSLVFVGDLDLANVVLARSSDLEDVPDAGAEVTDQLGENAQVSGLIADRDA